MTNREKYKDKLIEVCKNTKFHYFYNEYIKPYYNTQDWADMYTYKCIILTLLWLDEEYVESDETTNSEFWYSVEEDAPILVKDNEDDEWHERHFAAFKNGKVYTWNDGKTSWTMRDDYNTISMTSWNFAKLIKK